MKIDYNDLKTHCKHLSNHQKNYKGAFTKKTSGGEIESKNIQLIKKKVQKQTREIQGKKVYLN